MLILEYTSLILSMANKILVTLATMAKNFESQELGQSVQLAACFYLIIHTL